MGGGEGGGGGSLPFEPGTPQQCLGLGGTLGHHSNVNAKNSHTAKGRLLPSQATDSCRGTLSTSSRMFACKCLVRDLAFPRQLAPAGCFPRSTSREITSANPKPTGTPSCRLRNHICQAAALVQVLAHLVHARIGVGRIKVFPECSCQRSSKQVSRPCLPHDLQRPETIQIPLTSQDKN